MAQDVFITSETVLLGAVIQPVQFPYRLDWVNAQNTFGGWFIFWDGETTQGNSSRQINSPLMSPVSGGPFPAAGVEATGLGLLNGRRAALGLSPYELVKWRVTALDPATYEVVTQETLQLDAP